LLRVAIVLGDENADPPRRLWSRRTIDERIQIFIAMFRWAIAKKLISPTISQALAMVEFL